MGERDIFFSRLQITSRRKNIKIHEWKIWSIATYGFEIAFKQYIGKRGE